MNRGGFEVEWRAFSASNITQRAQAKLLEEFFEHAFQVVKVKLRVALLAAPKLCPPLSRERDGDTALFAQIGAGFRLACAGRRVPRGSLEYAANFEQRDVVNLVAHIVPQGIEQ